MLKAIAWRSVWSVTVFPFLLFWLLLFGWSNAWAWWDVGWNYRVPIQVPAGAAVHSTVRVDVDFAALLSSMNVSGTLEVNSPRIVRPNDQTLASVQEFTDSVFAGGTDPSGNNRGEIRFLLEDAGPATYYLYFDITANGTKAANPQTPINGNFERGGSGTSTPPGWAGSSRTGATMDIQIRPAETVSVTDNTGPIATNGHPHSGGFSYLIGYRSNSDQGGTATLTRNLTIPAINPGQITLRLKPQGWDSAENGRLDLFDYVQVRLVDPVTGATRLDVVGPPMNNYATCPFSPNYRVGLIASTLPGYGRYNFWDNGLVANNTLGMSPSIYFRGAEPWVTCAVNLAPVAGQTLRLEIRAFNYSAFRSWFLVDDVEWSVVGATLGTAQRYLQLLAEYHFEETHWSGAANEVKDASGNNRHGQAIGSPLPVVHAAGPDSARPGNPGTCRYGGFFGPNNGGGALRLPVNANTATGAKTTVAFWMYWNGTGNVMPIGWHQHDLYITSSSFGFNTANADVYGVTISGIPGGLANRWVHVVAEFTNGNLLANKLYINGVALTLSQQTGTPVQTRAVVSSELQVSGWGFDSQYRFHGRIDQVKVYSGVLTQQEVTQIYNETLPCPVAVHHYRLSVPADSINCLPTPVEVRACADDTCTSLADSVTGSATLTTNGGTLASTSPTFSGGVATTSLSFPGATDGQNVTVSLTATPQAALNNARCCQGGSCTIGSGPASVACTTTFRPAGFIFSATNNGGVATIPTQVAGTDSQQFFLRAVTTHDNNPQTCGAALTGNQSVRFSYNCVNPNVCDTGTHMRINSSGYFASNGADVELNFGPNGAAPFTFDYKDVGQITLSASKAIPAPGGGTMTLSTTSNAFVVKPYGFVVRACTGPTPCTLDNTSPNDGSGTVFAQAGAPFNATITAVANGGTTTPSFGRENPPEGVTLTRNLVAPVGGALGDLDGTTTIPGSSFQQGATKGVATVSDLTWSEVGIITLTATNSNYLGSGQSVSGGSGNVGRFYPKKFAITQGTLTPACVTVTGSFTYFGQDGFTTEFTLTAQNASSQKTSNYTGNFAKLDLANWSNYHFTAAPLPGGSDLSQGATPPSGTWNSGEATVTARHQISRPTALVGPTTITVRALPRDADNVTLEPATAVDVAPGSPLRYGRLVLSNVHGSHLLQLKMPIQTQYWTGSAWAINTLDSCTNVTNSLVFVKTPTSLPSPTGGAVTAGKGWLNFAAPNQKGSVEVCAAIGPDVDHPIAACRTVAGTALPWLQGNWDDNNQYDDNPAARATFGIHEGRKPIIYRRERY